MGRSTIYPYHIWFDGVWHSAQPDDYDLSTDNFRSILHQYAKAHNFTVRTVEWPNGRFDFCAVSLAKLKVKVRTDTYTVAQEELDDMLPVPDKATFAGDLDLNPPVKIVTLEGSDPNTIYATGYPYKDGDAEVIAPGTIVNEEQGVINHKGAHYVRVDDGPLDNPDSTGSALRK